MVSADNAKISFKEELNAKTALIKAALDRYGNETLVEDKSLEILSAMVYRKIQVATGGRMSSDEEKGDEAPPANLSDTLSMFFTIILIMLTVGVIIFSLFGDKLGLTGKKSGAGDGLEEARSGDVSAMLKQMNERPSNGKDEKDKKDTKKYVSIDEFKGKSSIYYKPFEFIKVSALSSNNYCGRQDIIEKLEQPILKHLRQLKTMSRQELNAINAFGNANFTLLGPPGTGKTVFAKYIATKIDTYLKRNWLKNSMPEKYEALMKEGGEEGIKKHLEEVESRALFCEVSSGTINSMYYGQSEQNVKNLFVIAKWLSEGPKAFEAIFLFFDEADSLFGDRSGGNNDSDAMMRVKSELLSKIGVEPNGNYTPIVIICATNRFETFDDAFKRRLGIQLEFGLPTEEERAELVRFELVNFEPTAKEVDLIVKLTRGRSHAFIRKYIQKHYMSDENGAYTAFKMLDYVKFLHKNRGNKEVV